MGPTPPVRRNLIMASRDSEDISANQNQALISRRPIKERPLQATAVRRRRTRMKTMKTIRCRKETAFKEVTGDGFDSSINVISMDRIDSNPN